MSDYEYTIQWSGRVNATTGLKIRSGPGTSYAQIGILQYNTHVDVIGESGVWLHILHDNPNAYVYGDYITLPSTPTNRVLGIDVSKWQDVNSTPQMMDFGKAVAAGAKFAFIKASQANWADEDIVKNWANAKAAGLLRGAYHFLTWDVDPTQQADFAWSVIKDDPGELPPVCDFEWWNDTTPPNGLEILWAYVTRMETLCGRKPIIYTAQGWWSQFTPTVKWREYPLWTAQYTSAASPTVYYPWDKWHFWQYTSKGDGYKFGAESGNIDLNWYNGDMASLLEFSILEPAPPIDPDPNPDIIAAILSDVDDIEESITVMDDELAGLQSRVENIRRLLQ